MCDSSKNPLQQSNLLNHVEGVNKMIACSSHQDLTVARLPDSSARSDSGFELVFPLTCRLSGQ